MRLPLAYDRRNQPGLGTEILPTTIYLKTAGDFLKYPTYSFVRLSHMPISLKKGHSKSSLSINPLSWERAFLAWDDIGLGGAECMGVCMVGLGEIFASECNGAVAVELCGCTVRGFT